MTTYIITARWKVQVPEGTAISQRRLDGNLTSMGDELASALPPDTQWLSERITWRPAEPGVKL